MGFQKDHTSGIAIYPGAARTLLLLALLCLNTAYAATFTVTNTNDTGAGSFRQAVSDANGIPGADTIEFGGLTGTININSTIFIKDDLTITGPGADVLVLNSTLTSGISALYMSGPNVVISDLTLKQDPASNQRLIYAKSKGTLTVRNVKLLGNGNLIAAGSGGAIAAINTDVLIQNSVVDNFHTTYRGAGVFVQDNSASDTANLVVEDSLFSSNETSGAAAESVASKNGGAIASEGASPVTLRRSTFSRNSTVTSEYGDGGAVYFEGDITIEQCYFYANASRGGGGAIYTEGFNQSVIRDSLFEDNTSELWGGAVYARGETSIENSTFYNNQSNSSGGALYHYISGVVNIVNSTFSKNYAKFNGGAISIDPTGNGATQVNILNTTIRDNIAKAAGGGINHTKNDSGFTIINSIIAGNTATNHDNEIDGSQVRIDFSLIGDNAGDATQANITELTPGSNVFDMDPMLAIPADNGGVHAGRNAEKPLPTYAVMANSPVIGAADANASNSALALPATDQRGTGFDRIKDGGLEMGAIEYDAPSTAVTVSTGSSGALSPWWLVFVGLGVYCRRRHMAVQ